MHKYITKTVLYSSVLLLSACGSLITGSSQSPATVTTAGDTDIQALIKKAEALPSFEYIHNNTQYIAYLNGQPELIKVSNGADNKLFFYKGGKVSVIQDNREVYHISGQMMRNKLWLLRPPSCKNAWAEQCRQRGCECANRW